MKTLVLLALACISCGEAFSTTAGVMGTGGNPAETGGSDTGGSPETGGALTDTGGAGNRGSLATGGSPGTGGTQPTGGTSAGGGTGGESTGGATGGAPPIDTGGAAGASTGGATGGAPGTGGAAGTGGYIEDPCIHGLCCGGIVCDTTCIGYGGCCTSSDACGCVYPTTPAQTSFYCKAGT